MKKLLIALLAIAAIAACEKEDTSEWGKSETLVRKYHNFDAAAIPDFITRGVLISEQEFLLEDRSVWYGVGCTLEGTNKSQYLFFDHGTAWEGIFVPIYHQCIISTWEYDTTGRMLHLRYKDGSEQNIIAEAFIPNEDRVILNNGEFRLIMRLHSDQATVDRFMKTYGPLAGIQE